MGHTWELFNLTVSDLAIVGLMIVVFLFAVFVPYPEGKERRP